MAKLNQSDVEKNGRQKPGVNELLKSTKTQTTSKKKKRLNISTRKTKKKKNCLIISHAPRDLSVKICPVNRSATLIYGRPA